MVHHIQMHSPTLQVSQEYTLITQCFVCFISRQDKWDDIGLGLPHCIPLPFTPMFSAARIRLWKSCFLNCKWVILLHTDSVLENNLWQLCKRFLFTWSSETSARPIAHPVICINIAHVCYSLHYLGLQSIPHFIPKIPLGCRRVCCIPLLPF